MEKILIEKLIKKAIEMLNFSYAPYSNFHVGAALLTSEAKYIQDATLKMRLTDQVTAQKELQFLKL